MCKKLLARNARHASENGRLESVGAAIDRIVELRKGNKPRRSPNKGLDSRRSEVLMAVFRGGRPRPHWLGALRTRPAVLPTRFSTACGTATKIVVPAHWPTEISKRSVGCSPARSVSRLVSQSSFGTKLARLPVEIEPPLTAPQAKKQFLALGGELSHF